MVQGAGFRVCLKDDILKNVLNRAFDEIVNVNQSSKVHPAQVCFSGAVPSFGKVGLAGYGLCLTVLDSNHTPISQRSVSAVPRRLAASKIKRHYGVLLCTNTGFAQRKIPQDRLWEGTTRAEDARGTLPRVIYHQVY